MFEQQQYDSKSNAKKKSKALSLPSCLLIYKYIILLGLFTDYRIELNNKILTSMFSVPLNCQRITSAIEEPIYWKIQVKPLVKSSSYQICVCHMTDHITL